MNRKILPLALLLILALVPDTPAAAIAPRQYASRIPASEFKPIETALVADPIDPKHRILPKAPVISHPVVKVVQPPKKSPTRHLKAIRIPARPKVVQSPTSAKGYALSVLGAVQYSCIDQIFTRESHWNYKDYNASSGAYGIPQALPGSKMALFGSDWRTNPITQVKWGIHYVNTRYGSACSAWTFWQSHRWY